MSDYLIRLDSPMSFHGYHTLVLSAMHGDLRKGCLFGTICKYRSYSSLCTINRGSEISTIPEVPSGRLSLVPRRLQFVCT